MQQRRSDIKNLTPLLINFFKEIYYPELAFKRNLVAMKNNKSQSRFELETTGQITFANYRIENRTLYIDYVETPDQLRGQGFAGNLMKEITEFAKKEQLEIIPICDYAKIWIRRNNTNYHI